MPASRAARWFSEICGLAIGVGLLWCITEIVDLRQRVDGLQKAIPKTIIQNNHQEVNILESPIERLAREIGIQQGIINGKKEVGGDGKGNDK